MSKIKTHTGTVITKDGEKKCNCVKQRQPVRRAE